MPLSLGKLQDLFVDNGYVPDAYFCVDGYIYFIRIFSIETGTPFLLYIPSKYEFKLKKGHNVYKMQAIELGSSVDIANEYAGEGENMVYKGGIKIDDDKKDVEKNLEQNYKEPILLQNISTQDQQDLKSIYRQVKRLRYCVQDLDYKIGIMYKNYMCVIRRDDSIDCYSVKNYKRTPKKRLYIITDLEVFYDKTETLIDNVQTVEQGIQDIIRKNQFKHTDVLIETLKNKDEMTTFIQTMHNKITSYNVQIDRLNVLLEIVNNKQKVTLTQLEELEKSRNHQINQDLQISQYRSNLQNEVEQLNHQKDRIIKLLTIVREKRENIVLTVDKIMFDNTVMFDCIMKNFSNLKKLISGK